MPTVALSSRAQADIVDRIAYLATFSAAASDKFAAALKSALHRLESSPRIGFAFPTRRRRLKGIRVMVVPKFRNYCIFYRESNDTIEVMRVLHGARDIAALLEEE